MSEDSYHKDRLGNLKLHPETLMVGYGYDPALSEGAVKPPVFLTSTFVFKTAEEGKAFFDYVAGRREPPRGGGARRRRGAGRRGWSIRASTTRTARSSRTAWRCSRTPRRGWRSPPAW